MLLIRFKYEPPTKESQSKLVHKGQFLKGTPAHGGQIFLAQIRNFVKVLFKIELMKRKPDHDQLTVYV